jgi:hypothetical protein
MLIIFHNSYMGCHPNPIHELHHFSGGEKPPITSWSSKMVGEAPQKIAGMLVKSHGFCWLKFMKGWCGIMVIEPMDVHGYMNIAP